MKKIEELEKFEGNGKVILLNTDNGHWARMSKEWYNRSIQTVEVVRLDLVNSTTVG